jgi:hypothetical protein
LSHRKIKHKVLDLLKSPDLVQVHQSLEVLPAKDVVNVLFAAICRDEPQTRWFAITCMGASVARLAANNLEEGRVVMRRLLWSLNDESGGIGWGAPESMAEIMCRHRQLAQEYVHMLVSYMREDGEELCQDGNFIEHPLLQRGLLWGVARMSGCHPDLMLKAGAAEELEKYLFSPDTETCGLAVIAAGCLPCAHLQPVLEQLTLDCRSLSLYREGVFHRPTVAELALAALALRGQRENSC